MKWKLLVLFSLALFFRLALIGVAHHGDLNNNISWGQELLSRGFDGYYGSSDANDWPYSAPNQPPLYILLFGCVVWLFNLIKSVSWNLNNSIGIFPSSFIWFWEAKGMDLIVKLPGILADLGIGWMIYRYFDKRLRIELPVDREGNRELSKAMFLAIVWLFNPITWYNSAIWGQTDSIVNFLGLVAVFGLLGVFGKLGRLGQLGWFSVWFTVAFLFKGSLGIFIPILLIVIIKQKYLFKDWFKAIVYSLSIISLFSFWFHPYIDFPIWFYNLYVNRILPGEIGYLTANAFNFWWLVDSGTTLDSTVYFGLSARFWGLIGAIFGISGVGYWLSRGKTTEKRIILSLAMVSFVSFVFMTRMHERYLYPFFPYATLLVSIIPSFWVPYTILSGTFLLNMYHLFWVPSFAPLEALYDFPIFAKTLSLVNLVFFVYLFRHLRSVKL